MKRRLLAAFALALALVAFGVGGASAAPIVPPSGGGGNNPVTDIGNSVVGGAASAILDKLCPPRTPPYPTSPNPEVVNRGGGPGGYSTYGYGGLTWTTYDEGCLSMSKADTSLGSQVNQIANSIDVAVNEMQATALDPASTSAFSGVIAKAVHGLHNAFWNPWALTAIAVLGLLTALRGISGRTSEALSGVVAAAVVLGVMFTVLSQPRLPIDTSNAMTSGVANQVASSLVSVTPGGHLPKSATVREKFTEGYYQVSYRAWLEGWSCGDRAAERRYGSRLRDAQAFTVAETQLPAAEQVALVKAKNAAWLKIGEEMKSTDPVAFACWKGAGESRLGAGAKHLVVSTSAGFWVLLGSIGLLALRWMLMLAILFTVTFGPVLLFSRRMQDRMIEFGLVGILGPVFVAVGVGTLLWGYYAILLDRGTSWWMSGVFAFALGLALFMSKGILQRMFTGIAETRYASRLASRGGRHARNVVTTVAQKTGGGTATAAVAGGLAGYGASEIHDHFEDGRREGAETGYVGLDDRNYAGEADRPGGDDVAPDSGYYGGTHMDDDGRDPVPTVYGGPTSTPAAHDALYRARTAAAEGRYGEYEATERNRTHPVPTEPYDPEPPAGRGRASLRSRPSSDPALSRSAPSRRRRRPPGPPLRPLLPNPPRRPLPGPSLSRLRASSPSRRRTTGPPRLPAKRSAELGRAADTSRTAGGTRATTGT